MPKLTDHTEAHRRDGKTADWRTARAIFMTDDGLDYCRENGPASITTHEGAVAWAESHFDRTADSHARRVVTGFRIEFW